MPTRLNAIFAAGGVLFLFCMPMAHAQYCPPGPYFNNCMNQYRYEQQLQQQRQEQLREQQIREQQMQQQQIREEQLRQQQQRQQQPQQVQQRPTTVPGRPTRPQQTASTLPQVGNPLVRSTNAHAYVYKGRSFAPVRAGAYRWPAGRHYLRYGVGGHLPRALIVAAYILANWAQYGLGAPPPGYEWLRYGPDVLAVDPNSGQIADAAYGMFDDDASDGQIASAPPPAQYYWVGIAWNTTGGWATHAAADMASAQEAALEACNQIAGNCVNADNPVPGDRPMCFAISQDGNDIFERHEPDLQAAINASMQNCQNGGDPGPGCVLKISGCNDHP